MLLFFKQISVFLLDVLWLNNPAFYFLSVPDLINHRWLTISGTLYSALQIISLFLSICM